MLTASSPVSFQPAHFYNTISGTLAVGTFINGGLPDIVCGSGTNNDVNVLLNNGDGTFHQGQAFYVPDVRAEAVADLTNNGNEDIIALSPQSTADGRTSTIYVFFGNGDGTFQTPGKQIPINYAVTDVAAVDVNGDGYPDLLITAAHRVVVFINKGDGTFDPGVAYPAGNQYAGQLVVGDFNGDGVPDVAVTRTESNQIDILLGQKGANGIADGTFSAPESYPLGTNPHAIAIGDFTGNGITDIAVANSDFREPGFEVLMGNGDGSFGKPQLYYGGNFVDGIAVGDFSGDGIQDVATVSFTSFLRVYAGNGDGTFQPFNEYESSSYGQEVKTADFTGDGLDDIAVATGGGIRVLLANSQTVEPPPTTSFDATIGAGGPKSITYHDVGGFPTTVTLTGPGSATIDFTGSDLSVNNNGTQLIGGLASIASIDGAGTTSATTLSVSFSNRNARANIGAISTDGSFKAIIAPQANLTGNLSIAGTIANLTLDNVTNGTITLGGSAISANLRVSDATNESLDSAQPIALLSVGQWYSLAGSPTQISAPAISHLGCASEFEANLNIGSGGLASANIRDIPQGTWTIAGPVGTISATRDIQVTLTAPSINSIYAGNVLNNVVVDTTGNIGSIVAGSMINSSFYAGVGPLPQGQRLPNAAEQFVGTAKIGSVYVRTRVMTVSFINSSLAAPELGSLDLGVIAFDNSGQVQGLAAESVGSLTGSDLITKKSFALRNPINLTPLIKQRINPADFAIAIV